MAISHGMSHPAVQAIAGRLDTDQQTVMDLMARTQIAVNTLGENWFGKDSSQFASDWASQSRQLLIAADVIGAMTKTARTQSADQQTTSTS